MPYEVLTTALEAHGHRAVTPDSTTLEVKDALYELMAAHQSAADALRTRTAWEQLRRIESRLVVDFFLYEMAEATPDQLANALVGLELPVSMPDFTPLAAVPVEPPPPPALIVAEPPGGLARRLAVERTPLNLGPLETDVLRIQEATRE